MRLILTLLALALLSPGCTRTPTSSQKSPDGTLTLTTSVNQSKSNPARYLCVIVDITDAAGKNIYHEITPASATQRWSIHWVSNNEILLKSSDIGDYPIKIPGIK